MTAEIFWLGRAGMILGVVLTCAGTWSLLIRVDGAGRVLLTKYVEAVERRLRFLRRRTSGWVTLGVQFVLSLTVLALGLFLDLWPLIPLAPLAALYPWIRLQNLGTRRNALITEQVEPWLTALSNALRASPSLGEAIGSSIPLIPAPMSEEIDLLVKEHELGVPLDQALDNLASRIDSKTLAGTVLALKVARRSGGNLPEMLASAAASLRELARLEGVLRTKTAEGRAQAFVIGVIPVPMVGLFHLIDPTFFRPLFHSFTGHVLIAVACGIWLLAILAAKKILAVDL